MEENKNETKQFIPLPVLQQAQEKLNEANALLSPYEQTLTPEERQEMLVMGDKSVAFVEKSYDFAVQNPSLVPSYLDMATFDIDKSNAVGLWTLLNTAQQVVRGIADTSLVSGSDAMHEALVFYNSVKYAASQDVYGAEAIYEELRKRFPRGKRKKDDTKAEAEGAES
jgi:hypothetical protein